MLTESENDKAALKSAALLHDIGLPGEPHSEVGFDILSEEIPKKLASIYKPLSPEELSTILYCVLWHRGNNFTARGNIEAINIPHIKKMAAILRVVDSLDRSLRQRVENISLSFTNGYLKFDISSRDSVDIEISRACKKSDLMKEAFGLKCVNFIQLPATTATNNVKFSNDTSTRRKILLVCGGNTCRSPMAKVILEQKLKAIGKQDMFEIDSAAYDGPTYPHATRQAQETIIQLYGENLLSSHKSKKLTSDLVQQADLILVMSARMKKGLPAEKTYTLKEYAGGTGNIADPFGGDVYLYLKVAKEISDAVDKIIPRLLSSNT